MAKEKEATVEVPVSVLEQLQQRLAALEQQQRAQQMVLESSRAAVLDPAFEKWKAEASRPAAERTQDAADREYGKEGPRWTCRVDATREDGRPGPELRELFPVTLSANSDLEAGARYLRVMGIRKHDYRVVAEPVGA